jgi:hypothetical protein
MSTMPTHDHHPLEPNEPFSPLGPAPMGPETLVGRSDDDGPPKPRRPTDAGQADGEETGGPPAPLGGN